MKQIPYGTQEIDEHDLEAVSSTLRSAWLTQGPFVEDFERALIEATGCAGAVAVSNATSALHLACLALGLGPGDRLWTSPNTFVASANCGLYCGAIVDFVDIDPRTLNMSVDALRAKLERSASLGQLPKIVVPVHFSGQPCDMAEIHVLSRRYGFRIIEDAAHALGARYHDEPVGNGRYSDATVLSFHPVKIITTGEGGAVLTRDPELAERIRLLRSHGITRSKAAMEIKSEGEWYYEQIRLGFNYRMTDLQAALGISQLRRLDDFISRRRQCAEVYYQLLAKMELTLPYVAEDRFSAWHLYVVRLADAATRRRVFDHMRGAGILVNVHYIPVHLQPWYRRLGFKPGDFPNAETYYASALTIPLYPRLSREDKIYVADSLRGGIAGHA